MASEFCPQCGTARTGSFRYCRSCQFDFESNATTAPADASPALNPLSSSVSAPIAAPPLARKRKGLSRKAWAAIVFVGFFGLAAYGSTLPKSVPASDPTSGAPESGGGTPAQPAAVQTLLDLSGSGIKRSAKFTAGGDWAIGYSYNCTSFGMKGNFAVTVYSGDGTLADIAVNELDVKGTGSQPEYSGGTYYLEMNSECDWHVVVKG